MTYATDGVRLLEVIANVTNYGLLGGEYVIARDASHPVDPDEDERLITIPPEFVGLLTPITI